MNKEKRVNNNPLVTINILSYNRKEELRFTLTKVLEQDYKNIEVIVVDNASSDGTDEMIRREFPNVKIIVLEENIGIAGWNKGFEVAKGEYVLVLDDDSYPGSESIEIAVKNIMSKENRVITACAIYNGARKKFETQEFLPPYNHFIGCGALLKRTQFNEVGGFDNHLFVYVHETDFAMRIIDSGYEIGFAADAIIYHRMNIKKDNYSPINNVFYFRYSTLNNFILNTKYLPMRFEIFINLKFFFNRLLVSIYFGYFSILVNVIFIYFKKKISGEIKKHSLNKSTLHIFNYRNMPLFDREYFGKIIMNSDNKLKYFYKYFTTVFKSSTKKNKYVD